MLDFRDSERLRKGGRVFRILIGPEFREIGGTWRARHEVGWNPFVITEGRSVRERQFNHAALFFFFSYSNSSPNCYSTTLVGSRNERYSRKLLDAPIEIHISNDVTQAIYFIRNVRWSVNEVSVWWHHHRFRRKPSVLFSCFIIGKDEVII